MKIINNRIEEVRESVKCGMQNAALKLLEDLFLEEVRELCGSLHSRKHGDRALLSGSDPGSVFLNGQRISVKKPRIKKEGKELRLETYQALRDFDLLNEKVMKHMLSGVSSRNYEPLLDEISDSTGLKKVV